MKAWQIRKFGPVEEVLDLVEVSIKDPGPDDVSIRTHAVSVNPIDYKVINGDTGTKVLARFTFPLTVGIDLSGVVTKVGSAVQGFKVGDEVFAKMPETGGAFAEQVIAKANWIALKPKTLSHEEAAAIPLVSLTSWQSLIDVAGLSNGQKVFIPAGSGGIGSFAIQLAKIVGAVVATTTSAGNMAMVKSLGSDIVIDYKTQSFKDVLRDYDVVYDTLGGKSLEDSLYILKPGGILVTIVGVPDPDFIRGREMPWYFRPVLKLMNRKVAAICKRRGVRYKFVLAQSIGSELAQVAQLIDQGKIRAVIDRTYSFGELKAALVYLQAGRAKGKVVAVVN